MFNFNLAKYIFREREGGWKGPVSKVVFGDLTLWQHINRSIKVILVFPRKFVLWRR